MKRQKGEVRQRGRGRRAEEREELEGERRKGKEKWEEREELDSSCGRRGQEC